MDSAIQDAKRRLPLPRLMEKLGLGEHCKKSAKCPFHDDKTPSFSASERKGKWTWKCFSGCGGGDEIDLLMVHDGLDKQVAFRRYYELAGIGTAARPAKTQPPRAFDWTPCQEAFDDAAARDLAEWRGFSPPFCRWLAENNLAGKFNGKFAFAVHDDAGAIIGCHVRTEKRWLFEPKGLAVAPLVIGDLGKARQIHVFESQWDAFSVCDLLKGHEADEVAFFITRGATNGSLAVSLPQCAEVFAWPQNDPEDKRDKDGKTPADKWLATVAENVRGRLCVVLTPQRHKDANDWTKDGHASAEDLLAAIKSARPFAKPIELILEARRFDIHNPPPEPVPILKIGEAPIATPENIVMIQAKVKAGKTATLGAIIASTMNPAGDCFGFSSQNPRGHAVIHFDTEQSRYHHHMVLGRALWRAGRQQPPSWLRSYYMKGLTVEQLKGALRAELERGRAHCGGVLMVILDGIGDFCPDVNDAEESFALVASLEAMAVEFQTVFVLVLHENPGTETGKTRGHLGSHLERKAETNLRLEKNSEGVTVIYSDRSRTAHIPKEKGPRFAWNDEAKMHMSTDAVFKAGGAKKDPNSPRKNSASTTAKAALGKYFARGSLRRSAVLVESRIKERSFDKYWGILRDNGWIQQDQVVRSLWTATQAWAQELAAEYPVDEEAA